MRAEESEEDTKYIKRQLMVQGVEVLYYYTCKTRLWLYSNGISMEHSSELVRLGALLHRVMYGRDDKDIHIDRIAIDFVRNKEKKRFEVHEVKRGEQLIDAHLMQLKYYLMYLEQIGIENIIGILHYPKKGKTIEIKITDKDRLELRKTIEKIKKIKSLSKPPDPKKKPFCKTCSYYELCWV